MNCEALTLACLEQECSNASSMTWLGPLDRDWHTFGRVLTFMLSQRGKDHLHTVLIMLCTQALRTFGRRTKSRLFMRFPAGDCETACTRSTRGVNSETKIVRGHLLRSDQIIDGSEVFPTAESKALGENAAVVARRLTQR